ncbi:MAG: hypothetical protein ACF8R9_08345 [Phycisphaerales bacterium JB054]
MHHPNSSDPYTVLEMTQTGHRRNGNRRTNHPSPWQGMSAPDRRIYDKERTLYWQQQWHSGRFNGLLERP